MAFIGRERDVFKDCYNLLKNSNELKDITERATEICSKYTDVDDKMFCVDMLRAITEHTIRTSIKQDN